MVGGPGFFCQLREKWLAEGICDLETALKVSEGRNIYCNTPLPPNFGQISVLKYLYLKYSGTQNCLQSKGEIKMAILICGSFRRSQPGYKTY
jgi:hypothetical protein